MSISASPHRGPAPAPASLSGASASASSSSSSSSNNLNSNSNGGLNGYPRVEFQAVILATSFGSALFPLTREGGGGAGANAEQEAATAAPGGPSASPSSSGASGGNGSNSHESIGRAHLPVANRPLLHYQLDMIHKAGFPAVIVVTRDSMRKSMARMVDEWKQARGGAAAAQSAAAAAAAAAAATAAATPSSAAAASGSLDLSSTPTAAQLSSLSSSSSTPLLDIDLVCLDTYRGTADALRQISEKIHTDFFCLSGDLISNVQFQNMADLHRSQDAGLIMCVQNSLQAMGGGGSGTGTTGGAAATAAAAAAEKERRSKEKEDAASVDTQYFGIDEKSGRLLLFKSAADVEESLSIDKRLLQRHPNFTLHTHFKDCHLYVFSQWVLFFLRAKPSILSIQSELIPCLVSGQYKAKYAEWRNYGKSSSQIAALRMSHAARKENEGVLYGSAASPAQQNVANMQQPQLNRDFSSLDLNAANGGSSNSLKMSGSMADLSGVGRLGGGGLGGGNSQQSQESFRIFVYQASGNTFCQRANTLSAYKALNHELAQDREYAYMPWPAVSTDNQALAVQRQMGSAAGGVAVNNFSVLGEGVQFLGDGVTIKRSCVARNCIIGAKVKMQGCVVMEGVTIEEGCSLTDCVISSYAVIGKNSVLKDCKIGPNFQVEAGTESKNEILCDDD